MNINKNPLAEQMRKFVRQNFTARCKKDDEGLYEMVVKANSVSINISNPHAVKRALAEVCGAPLISSGGTIVFNFKNFGNVALATGDEQNGTLTLVNKVFTWKPCTSLTKR